MGIIPPAAALQGVPTIHNPPPPPLLPISMGPTAPPSQPAATTHAISLPSIAAPAPGVIITNPPQSLNFLGDQGLSAMPGGSFLGDALCPLPEALRKRILNLEYVDMADLQPEAWLFEDGTQDKAITSVFKKRREPVTDILVWVQCYNALVGVLTERFPQYIHHFLAYQSHIIRSSKKSRALEWVAYDMAYRRKAAYTKSLNWAVIDHNLSATWFTGSGRPPSCTHCLSDNHQLSSCPCLGENIFAAFTPTMPQRAPAQGAEPLNRPPPQAQYSQRLSVYTLQVQGPSGAPQFHHNKPVCGLYNSKDGPRCDYDECKFDHCCRYCGGAHPAISCYQPQRSRQGMRRPFAGQGTPRPAKGRKFY